MAAKANLIMTNDIQVKAREIDFVTRFERNWEHLREILGIMRPIKKTPGYWFRSAFMASVRMSYPVASTPIGLSAMSATSCLCFYFAKPCTAVFSFSGIEPFSLYLSMR